MRDTSESSDSIDRLRVLLGEITVLLTDAGARDEALADFVPARRVLLITRPAKMVSRGRVWRLGVVLLTPDGELLHTGQVTRAVEPKRSNYQAVSAEIRREYRAAAHASGFASGETVNFDTEPVDLSVEALQAGVENPLAVLLWRDNDILVRWSAVDRSAALPFEKYLRERAELLISPPQGAT